MPSNRQKASLACLIATLTLLAGCGGDEPDEAKTSSSLRVGDVVKLAESLLDAEDSAVCPLRYDVASVTAKAGIDGAVTPAPSRPVNAEASSAEGPESWLSRFGPAAGIGCDYRVGDRELTTFVLVSAVGEAVPTGLVPLVTAGSGMSVSEADAFTTRLRESGTGTVLAAPGGRAAVVRIPVTDGGGALFVGFDPAEGIPGAQLTAVTRDLAAALA